MQCNTEVFSRVTGFFRPVQDWNKGKRSEFGDRKMYGLDQKEQKSGGTESDPSKHVLRPGSY